VPDLRLVGAKGLIAPVCCMYIVNGNTSPGDYKYIAQCVIKSDTFGIAYRLPQTFYFTECGGQGNDFGVIPTMKIKTRHPVEIYFGLEFPAVCHHCGVLAA